jgi:hypothetical protein
MLFAQINERFDGEGLSEVWQGDKDRFVILNNQLQLNASGDAAGKSYLSAPSAAIINAEWRFSLQMDFNPTSGNHLKFYLSSDNPVLTDELNGYYLQLGGNQEKQILLYRQTGKKTTKLNNSNPKRLDISPLNIELKVTRDDNGNWTVLSKNPDEDDFTEEFSYRDEAAESSAYSGFVCIYTKTNSTKFFFNEIFISGEAYIDTAPPVLPKDIVINEVLFNPLTGGNDYVEIYNRSGKALDLSKLNISNRRNGNLYSTKPLAETEILIFPEEYKVLTADKEKVCGYFKCQNDEVFLTVPLPAFANDSGYVVLTDRKGTVIDEFNYAATMHSPSIKVSARKGVALERQSFESEEWNSASDESGFGTPGYLNSKRLDSSGTETHFSLENEVCLPYQDKDGNLVVLYKLKETGYIANISIYNIDGRLIRKLEENLLLSTQGTIHWDGTDESGRRVPTSSYIFLFEAFHPDGDIYRKSLLGIVSK